MRILEDEKPTHILVAFDAGKTTFRHKTFTEYKGGRQKTPPELSEQFPVIRELLDAYQIARYELANYEADDIIGTLSLRAEQDGFEVKVISGDKDLTQLSSEKTTVGITRKGITDIEEYTPQHIEEKYGITPERIIDMKGLMGDSSDNIPGVPGVGEKTALKLLKEFGTLEHLMQSIDQVSGNKLKEKLEEFQNQALMSKELATILREAPIEVELDKIAYEGGNEEKLYHLFKDLGFNSLLEKISFDLAEDQTAELEEINYEIVTDFTEEQLDGDSALYIEVLEDNYHYADILGIAVTNKNGHFFISTKNACQSKVFKKWAEDDASPKVVYDAKRSEVSLRHHGIHLKGIHFDILLAAYIINPSETIEDLASIARNHGYSAIQSDQAFYGKGAKRSIPNEEELAPHILRKAVAMDSLYEKLDTSLQTNQQSALFMN